MAEEGDEGVHVVQHKEIHMNTHWHSSRQRSWSSHRTALHKIPHLTYLHVIAQLKSHSSFDDTDRNPFSGRSGAFDHITSSSLADGAWPVVMAVMANMDEKFLNCSGWKWRPDHVMWWKAADQLLNGSCCCSQHPKNEPQLIHHVICLNVCSEISKIHVFYYIKLFTYITNIMFCLE